MIRYQLLIEYVGTNFRGWQIQKKGLTIQGLIQNKLSKLLKEKIILKGSGRTDTGVHAIEQSAHFDCKNRIIDLTKFLKSINHFLNNKGTVTFDNFVVDGLDFKKTTHSLFTHHITSACAIDQDGSASDDSVYPGHVLNGAGYFKLKFDTPIDNWFFKTWF